MNYSCRNGRLLKPIPRFFPIEGSFPLNNRTARGSADNTWTLAPKIWNYGTSPATKVEVAFGTGKGADFRIKGRWKESERCLASGQMFNEPNTIATVVFPHTQLPHNPWQVVGAAESQYLVACITYTEATGSVYRTKLLYDYRGEGFELLDGEIE